MQPGPRRYAPTTVAVERLDHPRLITPTTMRSSFTVRHAGPTGTLCPFLAAGADAFVESEIIHHHREMLKRFMVIPFESPESEHVLSLPPQKQKQHQRDHPPMLSRRRDQLNYSSVLKFTPVWLALLMVTFLFIGLKMCSKPLLGVTV